MESPQKVYDRCTDTDLAEHLCRKRRTCRGNIKQELETATHYKEVYAEISARLTEPDLHNPPGTLGPRWKCRQQWATGTFQFLKENIFKLKVLGTFGQNALIQTVSHAVKETVRAAPLSAPQTKYLSVWHLIMMIDASLQMLVYGYMYYEWRIQALKDHSCVWWRLPDCCSVWAERAKCLHGNCWYRLYLHHLELTELKMCMRFKKQNYGNSALWFIWTKTLQLSQIFLTCDLLCCRIAGFGVWGTTRCRRVIPCRLISSGRACRLASTPPTRDQMENLSSSKVRGEMLPWAQTFAFLWSSSVTMFTWAAIIQPLTLF